MDDKKSKLFPSSKIDLIFLLIFYGDEIIHKKIFVSKR